MPIGRRIRDNNVFGTITDNPLTAIATTMNSAGLANLSAIAGDHATITLDPLRVNGNPEIVIVTAHAASATVVTITRAAYGTVARSHPLGTLWVHAATDEDFIEQLTSSTRPSDPYRGQMIFEHDTNKYVGRSTTDVWQEIMDLGGWDTTWSPTYTNFTLGNGTQVTRFTRQGRSIEFVLNVILGSTSVMGTDPQFTLPASIATSAYTTNISSIGEVTILDSGTAVFRGGVRFLSVDKGVMVVYDSSATHLRETSITSTIPMTWTTSDQFTVRGHYEAAL